MRTGWWSVSKLGVALGGGDAVFLVCFVFSARNPKFMVRITSGCEFAKFEVVACHGFDSFFRFRFLCWNLDEFLSVVATVVVKVVVTVVLCFRWVFVRVGGAVDCVFVVVQRAVWARRSPLFFVVVWAVVFGRASPWLRILLWF